MIGEIIKKARVASKMTTRTLAQKAKVTQSMVSRYESGKVSSHKTCYKANL
jgi:transcriptional regulator with XRE-family HTH domain